MLLPKPNSQGEPLFECDHCSAIEQRASIFVEETGGHLCLSCWLERDGRKDHKVKSILVEI
jgi:hypothetical protein